MNYDVIIIGGGPAGLTAGIYTSRRSLKTLILAKSIGGQMTYAPEIENYPAIEMISGGEISSKMYMQALKFGALIKGQEVIKLEKNKDIFNVTTNSEIFTTKAVILSFGKTPRDLGVPGENDFKGKGVSYCATCDSLFFKNKDVAVIGGGNSAIESAILLSKTSKQVYLIHRRDQFSAEDIILKELKATKNIKLITNAIVTKIEGQQTVNSISISDTKNNQKSEIELNGVFVEIGFVVKSEFAKDLVELDERNQIIIDDLNQTKTAGLFAAGDVTTVKYKQIIISAGEGAKAALSAYDYLSKIKKNNN